MARLVLIAFAVLSLTAATPYAPRQRAPAPSPAPRSQQQLPQQQQQSSRYPYQQPLPRPLTEVLSSDLLLQMADLVAGRPSAMPPTLNESGHRSTFNSLAARQAIAMTDSPDNQQVAVSEGKDDNNAKARTKSTACARAIVVCCGSDRVRPGCFEALGCPGFFVDVNPCSAGIVQQLAH